VPPTTSLPSSIAIVTHRVRFVTANIQDTATIAWHHVPTATALLPERFPLWQSCTQHYYRPPLFTSDTSKYTCIYINTHTHTYMLPTAFSDIFIANFALIQHSVPGRIILYKGPLLVIWRKKRKWKLWRRVKSRHLWSSPYCGGMYCCWHLFIFWHCTVSAPFVHRGGQFFGVSGVST
jgi:hypothetical protein